MYKELLGEELNEKVKEALKEKSKTLLIDDTKNPAYIPKSRFDEVIGQKNELKSQVGELTGQLEGLKKAAKDPEKLQSKIDEIQKQYSELEEKHRQSSIDSAVKLQAVQLKAKDPEDLLKYVDKSKLQFDKDGNVTGLEEQIKTIKEKKSYLFDSEEVQKPPVPPSGGTNPGGLPKPITTLQGQYDEVCKAQAQNPTNRDLVSLRFQLKEQLSKI